MMEKASAMTFGPLYWQEYVVPRACDCYAERGNRGAQDMIRGSRRRLGVLMLLTSALSAQSYAAQADRLEPVRVAGGDFVTGAGTRFTVWGVNYDRRDDGRLLEDYWVDDWAAVTEDFSAIKALGANVVRIHLQTGKLMAAADAPDPAAVKQLAALVHLAETTGLYLDITGLGCYHKQDVPPWYDALPEAARWDVQARFWETVAKVGADSPAVFCYDLMNEPILPGEGKPAEAWLAGEFGGKHFVQYIARDLEGRSREDVARAWIARLVAAIRKHDPEHLITVGAIPWAHAFPGAKPLFYAPETAAPLDFVSVHFYPKSGAVDEAVAALKVYDIGKPLLVEEMFPLACSIEELARFVEAARGIADGFMGFYWGKTAAEYAQEDSKAAALTRAWLEYFRAHAREAKTDGRL